MEKRYSIRANKLLEKWIIFSPKFAVAWEIESDKRCCTSSVMSFVLQVGTRFI